MEVGKDKGFEKPIELALVLDPKTASKHRPAIVDLEKKGQMLSEIPSEPTDKKQMTRGELRTSKPPIDADSHEALKSDPPTEPEEEASESFTEISSSQSTDKLAKIKSIIINNSGKVLSVTYDEQTNLPVSVLAKIPSSQFELLYSQLNQIGRLKQPLPPIDKIDKTKNELLSVSILLISSP